MKSKNLVILAGNVGDAPEFKTSKNSNPVAVFSMATNEIYTPKDGEQVKKTYWHRIVCFGNLAKIAQEHIKKGSPVMVQGKLNPDSYTDDNQVTHYSCDIIADDLLLCGGKPEEGPQNEKKANKSK